MNDPQETRDKAMRRINEIIDGSKGTLTEEESMSLYQLQSIIDRCDVILQKPVKLPGMPDGK